MKTILSKVFEFKNTAYFKWVAVIGSGLFVGTAGVLFLPSNQRLDAHEKIIANKPVIEKLNDLQSEMQKMKASFAKPTQDIDVTSITSQINELSHRLDAIVANSDEKLEQTLSKTLEATQSGLVSEIQSMKAAVNTLNSKEAPAQYLNPKVLPFKVVSIDSIQQVAVASIEYDYKTIPLEKGDALAGWKILKIEYGKQMVELENAKHSHVVINAKDIG